MADLVDENGNRVMAIGPLHSVIPERFQQHLSRKTLKSYLACDEKYREQLESSMYPADIPVIVRQYTNAVFQRVLNNLNGLGKDAVEEIHPWVLCTLIDWDEFDKVICTTTNHTTTNHTDDRDTESGTGTPCEMPEIRSTGLTSSSSDGVAPTSQNGHDGTTDAAEPDVVAENMKSEKQVWTKPAALKLIALHQDHEADFRKPSLKKITIWLIIGSDINKETKLNGTYSATQCEQKWKNITKVYRDTVDNNMKSGNERKECPYFHELQDFYGYRPNVTPLYVSSSIKSPQTQSSSVETEDEKDVEKQTSKKPKVKHNRKDAVVEMLQEMRDDMKQEQKQLMEVLTKQHEDRMANEKSKLELFDKLVNAISKSK